MLARATVLQIFTVPVDRQISDSLNYSLMLRSPTQQQLACCHKTGAVWEAPCRHPVHPRQGCITAHQRNSPAVGRVLTRQGDIEKNCRAEARPTADLQVCVTSITAKNQSV